MEKCKNRLPCGWCDRKDSLCNLIKYTQNESKILEEIDDFGRISKIFDNNPECSHRWSWQRSTSKGDVLYICEDCGAIKKMYPKQYKLTP